MGTEKRERQKANRIQRQLEEQRAERVGTIKRNVVRVVVVAALAIVGVIAIAWFGGAFDSEEEPVVLETPTKPVVELPAVIPTDLVVTTLQEGSGREAQVGDTVTVHYVGVRSVDGEEFDNSYERGEPFPVELGAGRVIQGWDDGLVGAQAGERLQLDIPAELAYGDQELGVIQPGDALTFVIDVMAVSPAGT